MEVLARVRIGVAMHRARFAQGRPRSPRRGGRSNLRPARALRARLLWPRLSLSLSLFKLRCWQGRRCRSSLGHLPANCPARAANDARSTPAPKTMFEYFVAGSGAPLWSKFRGTPPELGRLRFDFGRDWADTGRDWTIWGQTRPDLGQFRPASAKFGPGTATSGGSPPVLDRSQPLNRPHNRDPESRPQMACARPSLAQHRPDSAKVCPASATDWPPNSTPVVSRDTAPEFGATSVGFGGSWPGIDQHWSGIRIGPDLAELGWTSTSTTHSWPQRRIWPGLDHMWSEGEQPAVILKRMLE